MASTYTGLGTELMTTGENASTWGTKTNTNLKIIEQFAGGYIAGMFDDGDVRYIRITNLDSSNFITLTFRDEDNTEFRMKVDAGHSFIYPGDNSGGVVDTMKAAGAALASGLSDLVDITVDADTAACDVEIFVGSAQNKWHQHIQDQVLS